MPVTPTYPGVYTEEIPSGVRTITGVATSITAFIGRAQRGGTNEPVEINSFGDFERRFGGLHADYPMSYAVRDFYLNGGKQALIVRLIGPNVVNTQGLLDAIAAATDVANAAAGANMAAAKAAANAKNKAIQDDGDKSQAEKDAAKAVNSAVDAAAGKAGATVESVKAAAEAAIPAAPAKRAILRLPGGEDDDNLELEAANEGEWGNALRARVDYEGRESVGDRFKPLTADDLFNLTVRDMNTGVTERFLNVTINAGANSSRQLDRVLLNESNLVRAMRLSGSTPVATDKEGTDLKIIPFSANDTDIRSVGVSEEDADRGTNGTALTPNDITKGEGFQDNKRGLYALNKADLFNLLCIPADQRGGDTDNTVYQDALAYCAERRAMLIVDPPAAWGSNKDTAASTAKQGLPDLGLTGEAARHAAIFFPRVIQSDPRRDGQLDTFVPCGLIAGIMARTDVTRGVWKAPAGLDAAIGGIQGLEIAMNDAENGMLNPLGINCLRSFGVAGRVVWGARTLRGADQLADEYKYIPVRRLADFMLLSLQRGLQWVVFEPNDEPLWAQIRLNVGAFMNNLFRQGAFQGITPKDAYFVKCDKETTTQNDINLGIVNIVVGFAPLKPAEFVIIKLQQMAGQIQV
ncbi:MAG: phage tail sheath subtilisin-like domain-containing protein [Blastocatellia bacterium]|nr:phage tail sheath subtilisin-like domain-containing protein [Blastocatellia bacterium]